MGDRLPSEVLEKVLTFLPLASLCRFRTVCKKWNKLISCRGFASKHGQASSTEEYVLVTVRKYFISRRRGWKVLDIANERYFTLNDDYLTNYVEKALVGNNALRNEIVVRSTVAADGGLFCMQYVTRVSSDGSALFVCNPVLKLVKQLPCPLQLQTFLHATMLTDRFTMDYEIFVVDKYYEQDRFDGHALYIYESKTARWRDPSVLTSEHGYSMLFDPVPVIFQNKLFFLCINCDYSLEHVMLFSYDKITDAWCKIGIDLPKLQTLPWLFGEEPSSFGRRDIHLVVSGDHLFYVTTDCNSSSVKIFEISHDREDCTWVAESHCLHWTQLDAASLEASSYSMICVVGGEDWILIFSQLAGHSVAYSLSSKSWHHFPDYKPDLTFLAPFSDLICGGNHSLSLCFP